jgi:hypothetical protein
MVGEGFTSTFSMTSIFYFDEVELMGLTRVLGDSLGSLVVDSLAIDSLAQRR